jgi:trehalose/maltose hydrolase-like predicted phosphorylase
MSDITIEDVKRNKVSVLTFSVKPNLFRKDSRLNIGPKGFTGEKYVVDQPIGILRPIVYHFIWH